MTEIKARLEEIRAEIRAERVSMGELMELQSDLEPYIEDGDVELLEWAGVPEVVAYDGAARARWRAAGRPSEDEWIDGR